MLITLVVLLTVLAQGPFDSAQGKPITPPPQAPIPEPKSRLRSTQHNIVVQGCVQNGRLKMAASDIANLPFDALNVSEFILEGPKELLQQIHEQHNRHYDEIAGIATVPPPPLDEDGAVVTSKKGPVRITAGKRDDTPFKPTNAPQKIKLRVASLTHLTEGCVAR